jgi:proline iminopeptidase
LPLSEKYSRLPSLIRPASFLALLLLVFLTSTLVAAAPNHVKDKPEPTEGYFTSTDGVRLFYRRLGSSGNFVVFLHGGPGLSIDDGGYFMDPVASGRTLVMYDQRGGGRSDLITEPSRLTVAHFVSDLEALRHHFGIVKMALIGLSWGSGLAAFYADAYPDRVSRIVFLDPMPITKSYAEERSKKMDSLYTDQEQGKLKQLEKDFHQASDDQVQSICRAGSQISDRTYLFHPETDDVGKWDICDASPAAIRNQSVVFSGVMKPLGDFDLRPMLSKLKIPVIVIEGEKTNVPLDGTEEWARTPQDARMVLIPNAGHATFVDEPQAVIRNIQIFLSGKWPSGAKQMGAKNPGPSSQETRN